MAVHALDPYVAAPSVVHRLDPRVKVVLVLSFIAAVATLPAGAWSAYMLCLSLTIAAAILAEVGVGRVLRRSALALPFVLAAAPLVLTAPGPALVVVPGLELAIKAEGLVRFGSVLWKSWLSVQMAIILAATTPFPDLLAALRALGLPSRLVAIIGLMWRYLFVLADEAWRMLRAREARSVGSPGRRGGGSLAWRARVAGGMAGTLLVRTVERADRIYWAMLARGYDGEVRSLAQPAVPGRQKLAAAAWVAMLALLTALSHAR
jgi:cobalt/nickel transport system permease protein